MLTFTHQDYLAMTYTYKGPTFLKFPQALSPGVQVSMALIRR